MTYIKEACVGSLLQALAAEKSGANQVELCIDLHLDGNSPPFGLIEDVCTHLNIGVKVIVNPFPFRYTYSKEDLLQIIDYVNRIQHLPIQGIVFGPLTTDKKPDISALKQIKNVCTLPLTFHKAIDQTKLMESLELLSKSELVDFILSSGGAPTAKKGAPMLRRMQDYLKFSKIKLIAAGKITQENLPDLHDELGLSYYHGKKIVNL